MLKTTDEVENKSLEFLTKTAQFYGLRSPSLCRFMMKRASELAESHNLDFRPPFPSFCTYCGNYLIPGRNCSVYIERFKNRTEQKRFLEKLGKSRLQHKINLSPQKISTKNKLVYLCLECGYENVGAGAIKNLKKNSSSTPLKNKIKFYTGKNKRKDNITINQKEQNTKSKRDNQSRILESTNIDYLKLKNEKDIVDEQIPEFKIDIEGQSELENLITGRYPKQAYVTTPIMKEKNSNKSYEAQNSELKKVMDPKDEESQITPKSDNTITKRTLDVTNKGNRKKRKKDLNINPILAQTLLSKPNIDSSKNITNLYKFFNP